MIIAPDSPTIDAVPLYSHGMGQLVGIETAFMEPVSGNPGSCSWAHAL